jgi:UTP-glucose-1-phosphate uridylyltransferase
MRSYFYQLLTKYLSFYLLPGSKVLIIDPNPNLMESPIIKGLNASFATREELLRQPRTAPDYVVINGNFHFEKDIQDFLETLKPQCTSETRLIITYFSSLWRPAVRLADFFGVRQKTSGEQNWIAPSDVKNLLELAGFELVHSTPRILVPLYIPILSNLINRWVAPLPVFRWFALMNVAVAKPTSLSGIKKERSVSVVVAARNEAGNIEELFKRVPKIGSATEIVLIEGNSTDNTWETIQTLKKKYDHSIPIVIAQQEGKGKGDAVRKGFELASNDVLMILDADLTVPPEELPRFYKALQSGRGEFLNGSRLVYPMEKEAMRFFNIIGNKFFAQAFSFVLGQEFKDTLCGTKVLTKNHYKKIAENRPFFGDFDPFGDFDLLFGASRSGLKIIEVPIRYKERVYGETNISRWKHGVILLRMVIFAARKIKFV